MQDFYLWSFYRPVLQTRVSWKWGPPRTIALPHKRYAKILQVKGVVGLSTGFCSMPRGSLDLFFRIPLATRQGPVWHGGRICPWTMLGRICPWMKWDEVGWGANVTLVQGRMWPLLLRGRRNSFRASKGFFHPRESYSRVMRRSNSHFKQLPGQYGCYGVPLLRCNIHFEQLRRCFGCYVPTAISINFQHAMDATL